MYPVSSEFLKTVKNLDRTWALDLHMYLSSGEELPLTEKDLVLNSLTFKESSTCGNTIQTGSTYANSLDFTLVNDQAQFSNYDFSDARLTGRIGLQLASEPVYSLKAAPGKSFEFPVSLDSGYSLTLYLPQIPTIFAYQQTLCTITKNTDVWELCFVSNTRNIVLFQNGVQKDTYTLSGDLQAIRVRASASGFKILSMDSSTVLKTLTPGVDSGILTLFKTTSSTLPYEFGISRIDINDTNFYTVPYGSVTYSYVPSENNGFWRTDEKDYWYPDVETTADLIQASTYSFEYVPLGIFNVVTAGKKLSTIPFNCMDDMYKANKKLSEANIIYPKKLEEIFDLLCILCGISSTASLRNEIANLNLEIQAFEESNYTVRDIFGFIGVLLGKNLRINRNGYLESFWYVNEGLNTTSNIRVGSCSYEDYEINVTGVSVTDNNSNTYIVGDNNYVIEFEQNPLIQSEDVAQYVANINLQQFSQVVYHPCKVSYIGNPAIQASDIVEHIRDGFANVVAPVMSHTFKFRGTGTLEAVGTTPEQSKQLSTQAKRLLKVSTQAKKDMEKGLLNAQETILNQTSLITSALGFYPHIEYNDDGSVQGVYLMSTPEDTPETIVWAYTSAGMGVSHTGIAGPYTSSWTANDSIVAHVITADMIRTGMLAALDNLLTIDLSNGLFRAVTEKGSASIDGNKAIFQYWNSHVTEKPPVAYIKIDADESDSNDYIAALRIAFASNDGTTYAYIGQNIEHAHDGSAVSQIGPLTIKHTLPIRIEDSLEVADSIVYDHVKIQRKNSESGNTGIDFVIY